MGVEKRVNTRGKSVPYYICHNAICNILHIGYYKFSNLKKSTEHHRDNVHKIGRLPNTVNMADHLDCLAELDKYFSDLEGEAEFHSSRVV